MGGGALGAEEEGKTQPQYRWDSGRSRSRKEEGDHSSFLLLAQPADLWDCHAVPPPPTSAILCLHTRTVFLFVLYSFCQTTSSSPDRPLPLPPSTPAAAHSLSVTITWSKLLFFLHLNDPFLSLCYHPSSSSSSSSWNMALTGGGAGLFLHVCQVLFLLDPIPLSFPDPRIATWLFMPFSPALSFHPSIPPCCPSAVLSGVGPSLCAKVPPVYRAPDFPPTPVLIGQLRFHFLLLFF